jgi:hypothetical protein
LGVRAKRFAVGEPEILQTKFSKPELEECLSAEKDLPDSILLNEFLCSNNDWSNRDH